MKPYDNEYTSPSRAVPKQERAAAEALMPSDYYLSTLIPGACVETNPCDLKKKGSRLYQIESLSLVASVETFPHDLLRIITKRK